MKQYTHAWLALMATKRLEEAEINSSYSESAESLVKWLKNHRDFVVQGAWYPDSVIKDMSSSHVIKYKPSELLNKNTFKKLPSDYHIYRIGKSNALYQKPFDIERGNLPDRCEALAHSIIDNLKMQEFEDKGSPISPTNNHITALFFMLSHYIADAHMPLHCDARSYKGFDLHARIESEWEKAVKKSYAFDDSGEKFLYNTNRYPKQIESDDLIDWIETELKQRDFSTTWGAGNNNTWDFMSAITQYSYLTSYTILPQDCNHDDLKWDDFLALQIEQSFAEISRFILIDAVDSISKVWLKVWHKYIKWLDGRE